MRASLSIPNPEFQDAPLRALMEEYRCMYGLALFRLEALDRRVPVAGATLAAFLGGVTALPLPSRELVLIGVPVAAVWLLRVTINHARSFEDALRRIEAVERRVNALVGAGALGFQSHHPSRRHAVGGRTGRETVDAVLAAGLLLIAGCAYLFTTDHGVRVGQGFVAYAGLLAVHLVTLAGRLMRYTYEPGPLLEPPEKSNP